MATPKMPSAVTLGSDIIPVNYISMPEADKGQYHDTPDIDINKDLPVWLQASALLHEALHALDDKMAIGLTEDQTILLEVGIRDLIRSNNALIKLIQQHHKR